MDGCFHQCVPWQINGAVTACVCLWGKKPSRKVLMVLVVKEKCCTFHFNSPADTSQHGVLTYPVQDYANFILLPQFLLRLHLLLLTVQDPSIQ